MEKLLQINAELRVRGFCDNGYYDGLLARRAMLIKVSNLIPIWD